MPPARTFSATESSSARDGLRRSGLPCQGVNLFLADGEAAFQEVFHVHLHVLPRNRGDGFRIHAKWRTPSRAELDSVAAQVRDGLVPG